MSGKTLVFPYASFDVEPSPNSKRRKTVWRPIIEIIVFKGTKFASYPVLIDSGADYNIFHSGLLLALGGNLTSGNKRTVVGLRDQPLKGYEHKLDLKLPGGKKFEAKAIFSNQISNHAFGVVGQEGFFDKFKVKFDYKSKRITIN